MSSNQHNTDVLIVEKKDDVYLTVDCDPNVQREISEFFTFYVPGYKFMPAFRNRIWDGKIRLFSQKFKEIYFGLYPYIKAFAEERGYHIVCGKNVGIDNKVDKEVVKKFSKYKNIVIIGMGGSILGTKSIYSFLKTKVKKKSVFF